MTFIESLRAPTFADLFAGIGGMRLAFEAAGGRCVLTSEIDVNALRTYELNFPTGEGHVFVSDVNQIRPDHFQGDPGELDVLIAGFPCQPYSIAGLRKGLEDDRGGQIFNSLVRILKEVRPKSFLLENVKGIKSHDKGQTFEYMLARLSEAGYSLQFATLNSMTHGNIPQNRERVFIVGFSDQEKASRFSFPAEKKLNLRFRDLLEDSVDSRFYYNERFSVTAEIAKHVLSRDSVYQWRRQYVRENKSGVCPTLTANMGGGGHNVPLIRDAVGIRKLTPRETARLQGFPDSFSLPKIADSHLYHQFGNSVTVPVIEALAKNMLAALNS
jgi:DNA (cytosine-5)-methyltransferase 1